MQILIIVIALLAGLFWFYSTNDNASEKINSAISVIKEKNANALVNKAGKKDVILNMAEKRVQDLRLKLIALKTSKKTIERKLNDEKISPALKEKLLLTLKNLEACEKNGETALTKSKENLATLKAKLDMIETDIAVSKTATNLINDANPTLENNELEKLIESFETDLDNANAQLDVALLEAN